MASRARILPLGFAALALMAASGTAATAQRSDRRPAAPGASAQTDPRGPVAGSYSIPPGYRGTITSSTPNASGNFGGPGTGGGSGGGGK